MFDRARVRLAVGAFVAFGFVGFAACASELRSDARPGGEGAGAALRVTDATPAASETTSSTVPPTTAPPEKSPAPKKVRKTTTTVRRTTTTTAPRKTTTTTITPPIPDVGAMAQPLAAIGSSSGTEAARLQQRLLDLGFWLSGVDGVYGLTTQQAVMAFEKYEGLDADGSVDATTAAALSAAMQRPHARANAGTLVEIDKSKQLLYFVIGGRTKWILNTSTGNGEEYEEPDQNSPGEIARGIALTPDGLHAVNREREEGWWEGDLGRIYRPKYFVGGIAVHGSNNVPDYPASHGCVRVSVPAMDWIWASDILPMHTPVWVHDGA